VTVNTRQGPVRGIVFKVGKFNVDVDFNHPLAGQTLVFDVEILDVREPTAEEAAHGHAHGPGGVQHG
jgi:FKBP-type peptidyl-prolyl cis-trans isomerase SlyD